MNYSEIKENAKNKIEKCKVCTMCDTRACAGIVPGPGGKGSGSTSIRNCDFWRKKIKLNQDVLMEPTIGGNEAYGDIDTSFEFLGMKLSMPVMVAPIGMVDKNLGSIHTEYSYSKAVIEGAAKAGTIAFTGGGPMEESFFDPLKAMKDAKIKGIPTIKPWEVDIVKERIEYMADMGIEAVAMDIDSAGLPHAGFSKYPMMLKSPVDIANIVDIAQENNMKFIVKGVMTTKTAFQIVRAGAYCIVVSNHGGRVMDDGLSTGEVLSTIRSAVGSKVKILVDGGIRTGGDVCKALALGADGVLIGRPAAVAAYGGNEEGVAAYLEKIRFEMIETMKMTGCRNIKDINDQIITRV